MQKKCQVPTPTEYVKTMLDLAGYRKNLYGRTILENSCGEGNILVEIVRRYILDCRTHMRTDVEIIEGLQKDICAYEIDSNSADVCRKKLNIVAKKLGILDVKWNINNANYLESSDSRYDFIVGNPPYVTYHDLPDNTRKILKKNFISCQKGRFDYYYAFVEKSINSLAENGVLVYLIPFSIFRNQYAQTLRDSIRQDIVTIIDYRGISVFRGRTTSAAIIHIIKGNGINTVRYTLEHTGYNAEIRKADLDGKWFFTDNRKGVRFGDHFSVQNSVATLYNKAFLITNYNEQNDVIVVGNHRIEKGILRNAVSTKSCKKKNIDKIIFPYRLIDDGYEHLTEQIMMDEYPGTVCYLRQFLDKLKKRKINKGVKWFEYGRTQAIGEIQGKKLIIPMVITNKVTAYEATEEAVPYAGYFIKVKSKSKYDLNFAKALLEAPEFYEYVKSKGTPTTETSYRISVKEIEDYTFIE